MYLYLVVLGLRCTSRSYSLVVVGGLLTAVASLVAKDGSRPWTS